MDLWMAQFFQGACRRCTMNDLCIRIARDWLGWTEFYLPMRTLHELDPNNLLENDSIGCAVDFIVSNAGIYSSGWNHNKYTLHLFLSPHTLRFADTSHKMGGLVPMRIVTIFLTKRKTKSKQGRISNLIGPWTNQSQSITNQKYVTRGFSQIFVFREWAWSKAISLEIWHQQSREWTRLRKIHTLVHCFRE